MRALTSTFFKIHTGFVEIVPSCCRGCEIGSSYFSIVSSYESRFRTCRSRTRRACECVDIGLEYPVDHLHGRSIINLKDKRLGLVDYTDTNGTDASRGEGY